MKIKIGYLVTNLKPCGPIHILKGIVQKLDNQGFESFIFTFNDNNNEEISKEIRQSGSNIISLNCSRYSSIRRLRHALLKELKRNEIDVMHSHGFRPDIICAGLVDEIAWISTIHNFPAHDYPLKYKFPIGSWMAWKHKQVIKRMPSPVACSRYLSDHISTINSRVKAIQNGIDAGAFTDVDLTVKEDLRKSFDMKQGVQVYIYTGSLIKRKNNELIVKAFNALTDLPVGLVLLGEGPELNRLVSMSENNNVRFLGFKENVHEYLQAADVFISASSYEGLPNSIMEAMSCGLVCFLSDIEPHREIIGDLPGNYLFKGREDLSNHIRSVHRQDMEQYKRKQKDHIAKNFSANVMSERYQQSYRELIHG
jgi:glycosyltransferase involved in cell wall biosynthesis